MGWGKYDDDARTVRSESLGYKTKSITEIFSNTRTNSQMSPYGVNIRESRDSDEHPESFPIIIALDVTGSMGSVPHFLVKEGLPHIMNTIIKNGIAHPQVLFLAIGDHTCDSAPLQVGQFESSDELLDHWLTETWLEGRGGGNMGESYHLAWYFAARHTDIDSLAKRNKKGVLITIGDEPVLSSISETSLLNIMGGGEYKNYSASELLELAEQKYNCFHIHIGQTRQGSIQSTRNGWKELMGDNLIIAEQREEVAKLISDVVLKCYGTSTSPNKIVREKYNMDFI